MLAFEDVTMLRHKCTINKHDNVPSFITTNCTGWRLLSPSSRLATVDSFPSLSQFNWVSS